MSKPTIFFSHSSSDKEYIYLLKKRLIEITNNSLDIYLSSDGESIPFGNNWVHNIEENLHKASMMFVFVSPESINSKWVYFESGFSYSKNIKVIPLGIKGIDVAALSPPLNLLQGFNINSHHSLNNIISTINKELNFNLIEGFSFDDYNKISNIIGDEFDLFKSKVDYIEIRVPKRISNIDNVSIEISSNFFVDFTKLMNDLGFYFSEFQSRVIHAYGLYAEANFNDVSIEPFSIKIDSKMVDFYSELINKLFIYLFVWR